MSATGVRGVHPVGIARPGRRSHRRPGPGHPVEQGCRSSSRATRQRWSKSSSARASGSSGASCLARLDNPEQRTARPDRRPKPIRSQARSSRLTRKAWGSRLPGRRRLRRRSRLRAVRASGLAAASSQRSARLAEQRRREAAEAGATITQPVSAAFARPGAGQMIEPLAAKNIVPQTDLLERTARGGRSPGADRRGARTTGTGAWPRSAKRRRRRSQANFEFRQQALDERSQVNAKIATNEQSLRGARGKLDRSDSCARRSMASSTTSR